MLSTRWAQTFRCEVLVIVAVCRQWWDVKCSAHMTQTRLRSPVWMKWNALSRVEIFLCCSIFAVFYHAPHLLFRFPLFRFSRTVFAPLCTFSVPPQAHTELPSKLGLFRWIKQVGVPALPVFTEHSPAPGRWRCPYVWLRWSWHGGLARTKFVQSTKGKVSNTPFSTKRRDGDLINCTGHWILMHTKVRLETCWWSHFPSQMWPF